MSDLHPNRAPERLGDVRRQLRGLERYILELMSIIISSSDDLVADPKRLVREMRAGRVIRLADVGYTVAPSSDVVLIAEDNDEAEDMVSLGRDLTGVDNTIFVSTKGYAQHAARIKIAIDPPDALNATSKSTSMAIHDYSVRGENLPSHIWEQAKQFIERNRDVLLSYWECEIDTAELIKQLKSPTVPPPAA